MKTKAEIARMSRAEMCDYLIDGTRREVIAQCDETLAMVDAWSQRHPDDKPLTPDDVAWTVDNKAKALRYIAELESAKSGSGPLPKFPR
jgi:hypothetical protein